MRPIRFLGGALLVGGAVLGTLGACRDTTGRAPAPEKVPHFTVRGRQGSPGHGAPSITVWADPAGAPIAEEPFRSSVRQALAVWNGTGLVELKLARDAESATVTCSWRRGAHGDCPAFGHDSTVAHTGPVSPSTFIHLDGDREWSTDGSTGLPLTQVITHELGHVLGLGHSVDEGAVMHANYDVRRSTPTVSDLAGLASLYGSLPRGTGDVWIQSEGRAVAPLLHRVAPPATTGIGVLDLDSDGRNELLLWRTDERGLGQLMVYHFNERLELQRSEGPMVGCVVPGTEVHLCLDEVGGGSLISIRPDGRYTLRRFQDGAFPTPGPTPPTIRFPIGYKDSDLDGVFESMPDPSHAPREGLAVVGDLDGDGESETLVRFP